MEEIHFQSNQQVGGRDQKTSSRVAISDFKRRTLSPSNSDKQSLGIDAVYIQWFKATFLSLTGHEHPIGGNSDVYGNTQNGDRVLVDIAAVIGILRVLRGIKTEVKIG